MSGTSHASNTLPFTKKNDLLFYDIPQPSIVSVRLRCEAEPVAQPSRLQTFELSQRTVGLGTDLRLLTERPLSHSVIRDTI
jgi:hypothetical protein